MADPFEQELDALFAAPPALEDTEAFTAEVERRLRRRWVFRWVGVGAAALAGGAISVSRLGDLAQALEPMFGWVDAATALAPSEPYGTAAVWTAAGVAVLAVAAGRAFRRFGV